MPRSGKSLETPSTAHCGGSVQMIQSHSLLMMNIWLEMRWVSATQAPSHNKIMHWLDVSYCVEIVYVTHNQFMMSCAFQVLVAPVTEKGALQRDIYLPGSNFQWQDTNNAKVFDGGTLLQSYQVGLEEVPVFIRKTSWGQLSDYHKADFLFFTFYFSVVLILSCTFHKDHFLCSKAQSWDYVQDHFFICTLQMKVIYII